MTVTEGLMDPRGYRDWIARDQHGLARARAGVISGNFTPRPLRPTEPAGARRSCHFRVGRSCRARVALSRQVRGRERIPVQHRLAAASFGRKSYDGNYRRRALSGSSCLCSWASGFASIRTSIRSPIVSSKRRSARGCLCVEAAGFERGSVGLVITGRKKPWSSSNSARPPDGSGLGTQ